MTDAAASVTRARHHVVLGAADGRHAASTPVEAGPVAILPDAGPAFVDAVERAGGVVAPLTAATRGLVWTAASGSDDLARVLDEHPAIGWLQLPWAGVDAFAGLIERAAGDGRVWTSAKGAYAQPVAEHALMLVLAVLRELPRRVRATSWQVDELGRTLYGANVVIVGAGGIAVELLRLLAPFGARVTVVRRSAEPVVGADLTLPTARLGEALDGADVVVLAAALTGDSRGLIGAAELQRMPRGAVLVNVARGGLVDTDALVDALESGHLGGAGLDVTDPEPLPAGHPLWQAPNCIVTPHVADTEEMTVPLFAERISQNVRAFLGDGGFEGRIDPVAGY
ncbi:D-isomer specific 2-hydroxyacid dehydrogenase family protein [Agromyces cerinus]|uniref:Phosphoglycerate dehydrogenase n=1 Tax=Agromyces cerinus subsp. cerinus TaxID=232089 RepID=A0A1N6E3C2_9MICO|nr:D-isomer specific 2-hydroxyacid dehydrogenase family protein [Agromyces cerinus]SIN77492.1 Phosphoglycerate dehydrogenase [Agromyces cerinus subsp. cerinus]